MGMMHRSCPAAAISGAPGPSFVVTVSNAMSHGRRSGLLVALGLATADTLFAAAATAGLAALVSQNMLVVKGIGLLGGMWFVYGGSRLMLKKRAKQLPQEAEHATGAFPATLAYRLGFTTGAFNARPSSFFRPCFRPLSRRLLRCMKRSRLFSGLRS
jgi:threonine/homoserine/homoserine lactone efflux protein